MSRLRLAFSKRGSLAWISHLDTQRLLHRALRRSALPVSFRGEFHPLPRLQIALPLPLGVEGLEEWMDLELSAAVDPGAVRGRLQRELPEELRLLSCREVPLQGPSLSQELVGARWHFSLQRGGGGEAPAQGWPEPERWEESLRELLKSETWIWHDQDKKGRHRERDCRPALRGVRLTWVDPREEVVELELKTTIDGQGFGVRPEHLRCWLQGQLALPLELGRVRREALLLRAATPVESPPETSHLLL